MKSTRRALLRSGTLSIAIFILAVFGSPSASAQSTYTPALTVGAELQGGTFLLMPNVSFIANTSLPIIGTHMKVVPNIGVTYLFYPMTGVTGNWYIPVGAALSFPDYRLALFARNLFAIQNTFGEGAITFGAQAFVPFGTVGKSTFGLTIEAGAAVFWNTTSRPLFLINFAPAFHYDYRVKVYS